jgi:hypothetical protein
MSYDQICVEINQGDQPLFAYQLGDVNRLRQVKLTPALFGEIKAFR